jgi:cystathionine beta-synthase
MAKDPFTGATIASLRLKPVTSISASSPCAEAVETMREKGFDQLPVCSSSGSRLIGLVTLGNLLSHLGSGRAGPADPVRKVMFDFTALHEVVTDPTDVSLLSLDERAAGGRGAGGGGGRRRQKFVEITRDTPLSALSRFFEWNSAAVVTERDASGGLKAVAVVTKVDLLSWMVRAKRNQNGL